MAPDVITLRAADQLEQIGDRQPVARSWRPRFMPAAPLAPGFGDELANSLTHAVGLVLGVVAYSRLLSLVSQRGLTSGTLACAVYGGALVALYGASTTYHATPRSALKRLLRRLDHACIYTLIAGTYTPFASVLLAEPLAWGLLGGVWGTTLVAAWGKLTVAEDALDGAAWPCIALGWLALLVVGPLARAGGPGCIFWLLAGGVLYTTGVYFYRRDHRPLYHAAWHLFVLAGSACHFAAVWLYVVPAA